jgi:Flp pilus assembly protein TadG
MEWKRNNAQRSRLGATAVEFAFVAPVVLALIFGIFELTRVVMVKQAITNAAREGCRTASLATTLDTDRAEDNIRLRLDGVVYGNEGEDTVVIEFDPEDLANISSQTPITTSVEVGYTEISLLPDWILGDATLRVAVTMERE